MYSIEDALHDIRAIYPPFSEYPDTAKIGQGILLRVIEELGIENALTDQALLLLGSANRETQE